MGETGTLWRGLEELERDAGFRAKLERELPAAASIWAELEDPVSRRNFLQLMGASLALAGLGACTKMPAEKIIPYVIPPETLTPGQPQHYASSFLFDGYAQGILVESHEGRPTQIQGNPLHSASRGGSGLFMQASLLDLYDPGRSKTVMHRGEISSWAAFEAEMETYRQVWKSDQGDGVRLLTGTVTSPSLAATIRGFLRAFPKARWHAYQAVNLDRQKEAAHLVFGRDLSPIYRLERARIIVSLDGDFLGAGPAQLAQARDFSSRRGSSADRNRLYVAESSLSITGASADHRIPLRPSLIAQAALALAREIGVTGLPAPASLSEPELDWIRAAAQDLRAHPGEALLIPGAQTDLATQATTHAINDRLGSFGRTLDLISVPEESAPRQETSLSELVADMDKGRVRALLISGCNPAYATPSGLGFSRALGQVPLRIHHGLRDDETAALCQWRLPATHFLESWGDARAFDGTISIQQPLIAPLYQGRSLGEVIGSHAGDPGLSSRALLENYWREEHKRTADPAAFAPFFDQAIRDGLVGGTAFPSLNPRVRSGWHADLPSPSLGPSDGIEACFRPDPTVWDGSFSENAWLQELPKPLIQLTWSNAAWVSPALAKRLGVGDGDSVELQLGDSRVEAPILRVPSLPDGSVTLTFGYGRSGAGILSDQRGPKGYDAFRLLIDSIPPFLANLQIRATGKKKNLALVHAHHAMEGRHLVRHGTLEAYNASPETIVPAEARLSPPTLLSEGAPEGTGDATEAWAMVIDLSRCIGCNACVIACQAENNIPVVGEEEVLRGREMHWIRVDRYFEGGSRNPRIFLQPVPCMHCETAPCEYVCPTEATNHSSDGLNQMIYNRCVGTRYCSNNCPYKVRRFNFFQYSDFKTPTLQMMRNPDVTVRSRGVMEKCTYCVQRIQEGRIEAEKQDRPIRDGEIRTACEQACPTQAIVFGNKKDPGSRVARLRESALNYPMLGELGTRPRTTYLAHIAHPNPAITTRGDA